MPILSIEAKTNDEHIFLYPRGFEERVMPEIKKGDFVSSIRLSILTSSVAVGAAILGAHVKLNIDVPRDHCQEVLADFRVK